MKKTLVKILLVTFKFLIITPLMGAVLFLSIWIGYSFLPSGFAYFFNKLAFSFKNELTQKQTKFLAAEWNKQLIKSKIPKQNLN